jgi:hypothetical protein
MKKLMLLAYCLLALCGIAEAIGSYAVKDTLYVLTVSGLRLRNAPKLEAGARTVLPYGAKVVVQELTTEHDSVAETPQYSIKGSWVKVASEVGSGYVFDGYLSGFRPPAMATDDAPGETIEAYLANQYAAKSARLPASKRPGEFNQVLDHGIKFSKRIADDSSAYGRIMIQDISLEELYLLANVLCRTAAAQGQGPIDYADPGALVVAVKGNEVAIDPASGTGLAVRMMRQEEKGGGGGGVIQYKEVRKPAAGEAEKAGGG